MTTDDRWERVERALYRYVGAGTTIYLMYRAPRLVKIGQALNLDKRLAELRHDIDPKIIVMGHCTASPELEYELHRIFRDSRLDAAAAGAAGADGGTEWFAFEPILGRLAGVLNKLREAKV